VFNPIIKT